MKGDTREPSAINSLAGWPLFFSCAETLKQQQTSERLLRRLFFTQNPPQNTIDNIERVGRAASHGLALETLYVGNFVSHPPVDFRAANWDFMTHLPQEEPDKTEVT